MRERSKIMSLCLVVAVSVGMLVGLAPIEVNASMPTSSAGQVYDGVDFTELSKQGNHFYYGAYDHVVSLSKNSHGTPTYEGIEKPVLWRIMGEEESDGNITALSEYVLDTSKFHDTNNAWDTSTIKSKLNDAGGIIDAFSDVEGNSLKPADITTVVGFSDIDEVLTHTASKLYVPSIVHNSDITWYITDITWYGKANPSVTSYLGNSMDANKATLKGGTDNVYWWLRSPAKYYDYTALRVYPSGLAYFEVVYFDLGVRPALKLNPESVIFSSVIKTGADASKGETEADTDYVAASSVDAKNYKLTILGTDTGSTLGNVPSSKSVTVGSELTLTGLAPSKTTSEYTVNYKIVGTNGSNREIVRYGTTLASATTDLSMDTAGLAVGDYTAYVWLQKNNATTSHEGYDVKSFDLKVEEPIPVPVITSVDKTTFTEGQAGSFTVTATNTPTSFSCTGSLPNGVTFDDTTGILSGTPDAGTKGTYPLSIIAKNAAGDSNAQAFTLTVKEADTGTTGKVLPKTGYTSSMILFSLLLLAGAEMIFTILKKRKKV